LSTLPLLVGRDTCDHTIIIKVALAQRVQLPNHRHQWTVDIKTEFSDVLEIIFDSTEQANSRVY
jgi:hypothetical protein